MNEGVLFPGSISGPETRLFPARGGDVNGFDWSLEGRCNTCGVRSELAGPRELVRLEVDKWIESHESHEFTMTQTIHRPADEAEATQVPEFMRVVPVQ